ncbi:transposase [Catenulispora sp. NL8]|uniref:Transposase n=1 Tax=Catenulispora pinistramenti TaxID=2705254 RepID=A0ABS5KQV3_9ACTN|nr:transposase [Catenulispora pinistramenti]
MRRSRTRPDLEQDVRLPPDVLLPGQPRRGPGRDPAPRPRRLEHRRLHQGVPGAPQDPARDQLRRAVLRRAPIDEKVREAVVKLPAAAWYPAIDTDDELRDGAEVADLTGLLDSGGFPEDTRFIVRRERPHPGAQLDLFDTVEDMRHQLIATDSPAGSGSLPWLDARHRAHARVGDRIRCGKDTGFGRFPSRQFAINAAWLELALAAIDLLAWTQALLLDGELAKAEPKKLRYRLLHTAARITRGQRRCHLRIAERRPWARQLAAAFARLAASPPRRLAALPRPQAC